MIASFRARTSRAARYLAGPAEAGRHTGASFARLRAQEVSMLRRSANFAFSVLIGVSAFGQSGTQWRTAADVREGVRGSIIGTVSDVEMGTSRFRATPDDDR